MLMRSGLLRGGSALAVLAASPFILAQLNASAKDEYGSAAITVAAAQEYLGYLAGPECMGRGTGQPGYQKAAEYVADKLKEFGFKPAGDNGTYFQNLPFNSTQVLGDQLTIEGSTNTVLRTSDFNVSGISDNLELSAEPIFLTAGSGASALGEGVSLEGKIVIADMGEAPRQFTFAVLRARPAMVINVVDKLPERTPSVSYGEARGGRGGRVSGTMTREAAQSLATALNATDALTVAEGNGVNVTSVEGGAKLSVTAKVSKKIVQVPNVIGIYEGSDPALKHEYIGIGCHLDHLGVQNGQVYWGADDDGSGSAGVLLAAKAFHESATKPKRSIVAMFFAAEEMGLIGSRYHAENPAFPLKDMVCLFQMDMIGRNEETADEPASENVDSIHLVGAQRTSTDLHTLLVETNKNHGLKFEYDEEDVYTRSDHYSFAAKKVPVAFFFAGFHPDYHQPTDTVDKINWDKVVRVSKLVHETATKAANGVRVRWTEGE